MKWKLAIWLVNAALFLLWIALSRPAGYVLPTAWLVCGMNLQALVLCRVLVGTEGGKGKGCRRLLPGALALVVSLTLVVLVSRAPLPVQAPRPKIALREELIPYGLAGAFHLACLFAEKQAALRKCIAVFLFFLILALGVCLPRMDDGMLSAVGPGYLLSTWYKLGVYPVMLAALLMLCVRAPRRAGVRTVRMLRAAAVAVSALALVFMVALVRLCFFRRGGEVIPAWSLRAVWSHYQPVPMGLLTTAFPLVRCAVCVKSDEQGAPM